MVWLYEVYILVITTHQFEGRRIKCHQYWPLVEGSFNSYTTGYTVFNNGVHHEEHCIATQLFLRDNASGIERRLVHFQFISWPDYGVPPTAAGFLDFLDTVRSCHRVRLKELG